MILPWVSHEYHQKLGFYRDFDGRYIFCFLFFLLFIIHLGFNSHIFFMGFQWDFHGDYDRNLWNIQSQMAMENCPFDDLYIETPSGKQTVCY